MSGSLARDALDRSAPLTSPDFDSLLHNPAEIGVQENADLGNEYDPCRRHPGRQAHRPDGISFAMCGHTSWHVR